MLFVRDLLKKLAEDRDPDNWGLALGDSGDDPMLVVTYYLTRDDVAMLHVIDEDAP
jgi:hypothetical protein